MTGKNDTNILGQTRHGFSPGRIAGGKVEQIVRKTLNIRFARPISQAQKRFSVKFHKSSPVPGRHRVRHPPRKPVSCWNCAKHMPKMCRQSSRKKRVFLILRAPTARRHARNQSAFCEETLWINSECFGTRLEFC